MSNVEILARFSAVLPTVGRWRSSGLLPHQWGGGGGDGDKTLHMGLEGGVECSERFSSTLHECVLSWAGFGG